MVTAGYWKKILWYRRKLSIFHFVSILSKLVSSFFFKWSLINRSHVTISIENWLYQEHNFSSNFLPMSSFLKLFLLFIQLLSNLLLHNFHIFLVFTELLEIHVWSLNNNYTCKITLLNVYESLTSLEWEL